MRDPLDYEIPPKFQLLGVVAGLFLTTGALGGVILNAVRPELMFWVYPVLLLLIDSGRAIGTVLWVRELPSQINGSVVAAFIKAVRGNSSEVTRSHLVQVVTFGALIAGLGAGVAAGLGIAVRTHSILAIGLTLPWLVVQVFWLAIPREE